MPGVGVQQGEPLPLETAPEPPTPPIGTKEDQLTPDEVQLSKALSKLLRHDAISMNVAISQEGWVLVSDALEYVNRKRPRQPWSEEDVVRVVTGNDKQRFALRERGDGRSELRANQGHSMLSISVDMVPTPTPTPTPLPLSLPLAELYP